MTTGASDRRRRNRVPLASRIRHSLYQAAGMPVEEENSAVDLSSSGVSFETRREYPKGALVLLDVLLPESPLKLLVCIAWVKGAGDGLFQVGAEVVAIDPHEKRKMLGAIDTILKKAKKAEKTKKASRRPAKKQKKSKKKKTSR